MATDSSPLAAADRRLAEDRQKGLPVASVSANEALGWPVTRRGHDEMYSLQWCSPRRRRSSWPKMNVAAGSRPSSRQVETRPPGLAEVAAAKADGRWAAAYESQRNASAVDEGWKTEHLSGVEI